MPPPGPEPNPIGFVSSAGLGRPARPSALSKMGSFRRPARVVALVPVGIGFVSSAGPSCSNSFMSDVFGIGFVSSTGPGRRARPGRPGSRLGSFRQRARVVALGPGGPVGIGFVSSSAPSGQARPLGGSVSQGRSEPGRPAGSPRPRHKPPSSIIGTVTGPVPTFHGCPGETRQTQHFEPVAGEVILLFDKTTGRCQRTMLRDAPGSTRDREATPRC
jgi:hypothetical protein